MGILAVQNVYGRPISFEAGLFFILLVINVQKLFLQLLEEIALAHGHRYFLR